MPPLATTTLPSPHRSTPIGVVDDFEFVIDSSFLLCSERQSPLTDAKGPTAPSWGNKSELACKLYPLMAVRPLAVVDQRLARTSSTGILRTRRWSNNERLRDVSVRTPGMCAGIEIGWSVLERWACELCAHGSGWVLVDRGVLWVNRRTDAAARGVRTSSGACACSGREDVVVADSAVVCVVCQPWADPLAISGQVPLTALPNQKPLAIDTEQGTWLRVVCRHRRKLPIHRSAFRPVAPRRRCRQ